MERENSWLEKFVSLFGSIASITGFSITGAFGFYNLNNPGNAMWWFIAAVLFIVLFFVLKVPFYRGVFAVSAIIINSRNEILLIREGEDQPWKQPGEHYKMNRIVFRKKLETPFEFIQKVITEEVGIESERFKHFNYNNTSLKI